MICIDPDRMLPDLTILKGLRFNPGSVAAENGQCHRSGRRGSEFEGGSGRKRIGVCPGCLKAGPLLNADKCIGSPDLHIVDKPRVPKVSSIKIVCMPGYPDILTHIVSEVQFDVLALIGDSGIIIISAPEGFPDESVGSNFYQVLIVIVTPETGEGLESKHCRFI